MKRPLVVIAVGYIIGILWGLYCNCSIALLYVIIYFLLALKKINKKTKTKFKLFSIKRYIRYLKIIINFKVIIIIITSSIISNSIVIYQKNKYDTLYSNIQKVNLIGIVVSNPKFKEKSKVYKIKVKKLNNNNKYKDSYLLLYVKEDNQLELEYGSKIEIKGEFKEASNARNYKGFNYKEYLKTKKIYGIIKSYNIKVIEKKSINDISINSNKLFLKIKNSVQNNMPEDLANIILGVMLGYTDELDEKIIQQFRDGNMAHMLAVSGLHIMYIILIISKIFNKIIGKNKTRIITIFVLIEYLFLTGFSPSVVRACSMGIIMLVGKIIHRKSDTWSSISLSAIVLLIYNPFLIISVSFLLSYGATIGIIIFNKSLVEKFETIRIKDIIIRYNIRKYSKIIKYIKETFAISISVQIIIMPIILIYYNTLAVSFIITGLIVSLIIGPLMIIALLLIIVSVLIPNALKHVLFIPTLFINLIVYISKLGSIQPFNKLYLKTPNIIFICLYYIIVFFLLFIHKIYYSKSPSAFEYRIRNLISLIKYKIKSKRKKVVLSLILLIFIVTLINAIPKDLRVYFIDVGQGDSTLIVTPMNKKILIDGGGSTDPNYDIGKSVLLPYLLDRQINKIDYIIISHFDQDHVRRTFYNN